MVRSFLSAVALCAAAASVQAEAIASPFSQPDQVWQLATLRGVDFPKDSTLEFGEDNRVAGKALCNRFMGQADWTPERLSFGPMGTTMMACPDLDQERLVLQALAEVTKGGIVGGQLVLTLSDGSQMVYLPAEPETETLPTP